MLLSQKVKEPADTLVVYVTAPASEASRIARGLVEKRVAACVNVVPGVRSFYRWKGDVEDEQEDLLIVKTTAGGFESLRAGVLDLHPYDVPEVIAVPICAGHGPYLDWVRSSVGAEP